MKDKSVKHAASEKYLHVFGNVRVQYADVSLFYEQS